MPVLRLSIILVVLSTNCPTFCAKKLKSYVFIFLLVGNFLLFIYLSMD